MKKILYICPNGYLGGAETFVVNVCHLHRSNQKYNPTILFFQSGQAVELAKSLGIKTIILRRKFRLLNPIRLFMASLEIRNIVLKDEFRVIHYTMPYSLIACFLLIFHQKVKKVWFQHGPVGGKLDFIASFFPIDALIFNSSYTRDRHLESTPCFTQNHFVLPLGVNLPENQTSKKETIHSPEYLQLISVGRICEGKNQYHLLQAFHRLLKKNANWKNSKILLSFVGSAMNDKDQIYADKMFNYVTTNQLEQNIKFLPHQKDMDAIYKSADILVHTPKNPEAFGLVIAEAMSYNVSVVASREGGSMDLLSKKEVAYIVDSLENLENILETAILEHLDLKMQPKIQKMREQAYHLIQRNFSHQSMIEKLEEIYDSLGFN